MMIKILFVTADPSDLSRLRLSKELRAAEESIKLSRNRGRFEVKHAPATRHHDFIRALIDFEPDIVHFSGHGSDGAIWLENESGESSPAAARDLDRIFEQLRGKISCVVLNSCYSRTPAAAILPHVRHVISTRKPISDDMATGFSRGFYSSVASGRDVAGAFQIGLATTGVPSSDLVLVLDTNLEGVSLDLRFSEHLPVMIGMRCSRDDFDQLCGEANEAMVGFDLSQERRRDLGLRSEDYSFYYERGWLPADPEEWQGAILKGCEIVGRLGGAVSGAKVYHFFMRVPASYAIGLGAALGTKQEVVIHHYQKSSSRLAYTPILTLTVPACDGRGPQIVRLPVDEPFEHISTEGMERPARKMYIALDFAPKLTGGVDELALRNKAGFARIKSIYSGDIPLDVDWLRIAREINTVLLTLLAEGCAELHLFPAMPGALAFAVGMGLDTRSHVAVHHWYTRERRYSEVLRLNDLVPPPATRLE